LAELERIGSDAQGEKLIVELAEANRHPRSFYELAADDSLDERLVEEEKKGRGDEDENDAAGGDGPDPKDPPERPFHAEIMRGRVSIFKSLG
jgi:hypothetical protein